MQHLTARSKIGLGLGLVVLAIAAGVIYYFRSAIFPQASTLSVTPAPYCPTSIPAPLFDGTINVLTKGLVADGRTNNSPALQAILDTYSEQDTGATLYFPAGEYRFDSTVLIPRDPVRCNPVTGKFSRTPSGAREISFLGDGRGQTVLKTNTVVGPLFTWNDTNVLEGTTRYGTNGKASFREMTLSNNQSKGTLIVWRSRNPELDKMQLNMSQVDIEYFGNNSDDDEIAALDFSGIFLGHIYDVVVKGGSPIDTPAPGIGLRINRGSLSSFDNIAFVPSSTVETGRALSIENAGIFDFARITIDGGNQRDKPVYLFKNLKQIIATSLSGTNITRAGAFVRVENSLSLTFENLVAPAITNNNNANLIELVGTPEAVINRQGSRGLIFTGGELDDQAARGGSGKALVIDGESNFVVANQLMMQNASNNITYPATKDIALDLLNTVNDVTQRTFFGNHRELAEAADTSTDLFDENGDLRVKLGVGSGLASFFNRFPNNPILTLKGAVGQSANVLSVKDSNNIEKSAIGPNGELKIGEDGTPIKKHISTTITVDPSSIGTRATFEQPVAIEGLRASDTVVVTPSTAPEAGLVWQSVATNNTLKLRFTNLTNGTLDPTSRTWRVDIWQYD